MTKLADVASVIRSKNAGPYELTFDIIFKEKFWFEEAKRVQLISAKLISALYNIDEADVLSIIAFEPAYAIKATIKRPMVSGGIGESDVYGAQQHAPLLGITFGNE